MAMRCFWPPESSVGSLQQEARLDAHVGGELVDLGAHRALLGAAELAHGAREDRRACSTPG